LAGWLLRQQPKTGDAEVVVRGDHRLDTMGIPRDVVFEQGADVLFGGR
jgi:hypothetical protein